jgi:pimeloyl-ACP methyl ester carboxylesterase
MLPWPLRTLVVASAFTAAMMALGGCADDAAHKRGVTLRECRLPNLSTLAQCGEIEVPEDRAKPDGRRITIFAAVLPANTLNPKDDPFVILAGGPGQAASHLAPFASRLAEIRRSRDIVLIDQRGTGRSSPLTCEAFKPFGDGALETDPLPRARQCAEQLRARGVDAAQYTTTAWIADLEAMRGALGYARWNLWGGSYGTRVAQEYLRRHPERIRTVSLDGVLPPAMIVTLDVWRTREDTLAAVFHACMESPACRAAHPDPAAALQNIARALGPAGREVELVDPRTGEPTRMHVTFDTVLGALQPLTYAPELSSMLPEMLALAAAGNYGPLFASTQSVAANVAEQLNAALHYSVTCAEDVPRITPALAAAALAGLPTRGLARNVIAVCDAWPRGTMPADFTEPVRSDTPVLLFSGAMDPVTPPAGAAAVAKTLPRSMSIVARGYGHIVSPVACGPRLLATFVDDAGFDRLSVSCVKYFENSAPPPMWPDRLAPRP